MYKLLKLCFIVVSLVLYGHGQTTFTCQDVQPLTSTVFIIPCNITGSTGTGDIGWGSISNNFFTSQQASSITFSLIEGTQRLPVQCNGTISNPCSPAITPMTVYIYMAEPGTDFHLVSINNLSSDESFNIEGCPQGTQFIIFTAGHIPNPRLECFFFCSWTVEITLNP